MGYPLTGFWASVDRTLDRLEAERPATFDGVRSILNADDGPRPAASDHADHAFFAGSGGDRTFAESLTKAGWYITWYEAAYYYGAHNPASDETLSYCEGDVYRGDRRADPAAYTAAYAGPQTGAAA